MFEPHGFFFRLLMDLCTSRGILKRNRRKKPEIFLQDGFRVNFIAMSWSKSKKHKQKTHENKIQKNKTQRKKYAQIKKNESISNATFSVMGKSGTVNECSLPAAKQAPDFEASQFFALTHTHTHTKIALSRKTMAKGLYLWANDTISSGWLFQMGRAIQSRFTIQMPCARKTYLSKAIWFRQSFTNNFKRIIY